MTVRNMVEKILKTYGTSTTLIRQDGKTLALKAFLQPRKALSQRNAIRRISPLGEILGDTYLFICSADCGADVGDQLVQQEGIHYELRQVEKVMYKEEPIYLWGLCVQKGRENAWDGQ